MKIGILQPMYIPWLGYFEQIAYVDLFVFMDDVQYTRHDWRNRNLIKSPSGSFWLTVPVCKHSQKTEIRDIEINYESNWIYKHTRSIEFNYNRCKYFRPLFDDIKEILHSKPKLLQDLNCQLIKLLTKYLQIETEFAFSSQVKNAINPENFDTNEEQINEQVVKICEHFNADIFYEGATAQEYIDVDFFRKKGIEVEFQDYQHPVYNQQYEGFESHLSIIDLVLNEGPKSGKILRSSPVSPLLK